MPALKNDCSLFASLFISCQSREGGLENVFQHENQPYPTSLSKLGALRSDEKSQILKILLKPTGSDSTIPSCSSSEDEILPDMSDLMERDEQFNELLLSIADNFVIQDSELDDGNLTFMTQAANMAQKIKTFMNQEWRSNR